MSKKHRPDHHEHTANRDSQGEEKSTNRHVYIEPGVQIDLVQDLRQRYIAAQTESSAQNKKQLFWTKTGAFLVAVYSAITFFIMLSAIQANRQARDAYFMQARPWVGHRTVQHIKYPDRIGFKVFFENAGNTPALNVTVLIAGAILDTATRAKSPSLKTSRNFHGQ